MPKFDAKDIPALLFCAALIALGLLFDLFDFDISHLLGNGLVAVVAATVGVLLSRRSATANAFADDMYRRAKAAEAELCKRGIELPE